MYCVWQSTIPWQKSLAKFIVFAVLKPVRRQSTCQTKKTTISLLNDASGFVEIDIPLYKSGVKVLNRSRDASLCVGLCWLGLNLNAVKLNVRERRGRSIRKCFG